MANQRRKRIFVIFSLVLVVLFAATLVARALAPDELAFLDGLHPRRSDGEFSEGRTQELLIFPKETAPEVAVLLTKHLPLRGWRQPDVVVATGSLRFERSAGSEVLIYLPIMASRRQMDRDTEMPFSYGPGECVVAYEIDTPWLERQAKALARSLQLK